EGDPWSITTVLVSKVSLAGMVNAALAPARWCATFTVPEQAQNFDQTLALDPAPDLKCGENAAARSCEQECDRECSQNKDCEPHWDCSGLFKLPCEIDKARYKGQCETEKSSAKGACELAKSTCRTSCETSKELNKKGCEINQGWLNN